MRTVQPFYNQSESQAFFLAALLASSAGALAAINTTGNVDPADPSTSTSSTTLYIGKTADGAMTVNAGSALESNDGNIGYDAQINGAVTVDGSGSAWNNSSLYVGYSGNGTIDVTNGANVSSMVGYIGIASGSTGSAKIDGVESSWNVFFGLIVGFYGDGTLDITNGGVVNTVGGGLGYFSDSSGVTTIDGTGSIWNTHQNFYVGISGTGTLHIKNGGKLAVIGDASINSPSQINLAGGILQAKKLNNAGRLAGSGLVEADVASSGAIAPGNSPGTLSITGDLTLDSGANFEFDLGPTSDLLAIAGQLIHGSGDGPYLFEFADGGSFAPGTYTLMTFASSEGISVGDFGFTSGIAGLDGHFVLNSDNLQFVAVPEPGSWSIIMLVGMGLLRRRKRHAVDY